MSSNLLALSHGAQGPGTKVLSAELIGVLMNVRLGAVCRSFLFINLLSTCGTAVTARERTTL